MKKPLWTQDFPVNVARQPRRRRGQTKAGFSPAYSGSMVKAPQPCVNDAVRGAWYHLEGRHGAIRWIAEAIDRNYIDEHQFVWRWTARNHKDGTQQMFSGGALPCSKDAVPIRSIGVEYLIVYLQQPMIEQTLDVQLQLAKDVAS